MRKKTIVFFLAMSLMLSSALTAFAAVPKGSVAIGDKAYDLNYANSTNRIIRSEIQQELVKGGAVYVKAFSGQWIDNVTRKVLLPEEVLARIPALTYKDGEGRVTRYEKGDGGSSEQGSLEVISID